MLDKIITYSFYLLFLLTPLFWTSKNFELFEFNKMLLVYGFTVLIVGAWILKMINRKSFIFNRTPLDIPLLLFLGANILSTIFSIDTHTSIWGYYSRSNGGLLSLISYLLLYWAFVSNFPKREISTLLKFGLAGGFIISIYAILEHFGISSSCVILRGEFNTSCWVQDVQARVFATLGQPNWLAGYLSMLIFPALYFFLTTKDKIQPVTSYLLLVTYYLAFTFTYSRGPTLGLISGLIVFLSLYVYSTHTWHGLHRITVIIISFLLINLLFGSALTSFRLVSKFAAPAREAISLPAAPATGTQLETGGTESGQIRLIVWKGALDIFKAYPLFGSGVETFAYSYYRFRPVEHNLVSEWDFLYNKAHNEYLNYLATTGIVGLGSYSIIIITFIISIIRLKGEFQAPLILKRRGSNHLLLYSLLASYISYLIYNFFLFSVVIMAIFFFLFPALALVASGSASTFHLPSSKFHLLTAIIYRRKIYTKMAKGLVVFSTFYLLFSIFQLWRADIFFAKGQRALNSGSIADAYNFLAAAKSLKRNEPLYRSELAYATALSAVALETEDASLSAELRQEALDELETTLTKSPNNVSLLRTAVRTYFALSTLDEKYTQSTIETLDRAISLAPTDPKLYYNKALILQNLNQDQESIAILRQTLELKPNYPEAKAALEEATTSANQ